MQRKWFVLPSLVFTACAARAGGPGAAASDPAAPSTAAVSAALSAFLTAFENLDWEPFRTSFADDACVFFPSARTPDRLCGRAAVEARFRQVFDDERRGAVSGPPYLQLRPAALEIQMLGDGAAVASFHLRNQARVARRTIVFRSDGGRWRIAHLHASNVPWPDAPADGRR